MTKKRKGQRETAHRSSDLPVERRVVLAPEGQPGVKAQYIERRGIREHVVPIMGDDVKQLVAYMRSPKHPANIFEDLQKRAAEILSRAGIKHIDDVLKELRTSHHLSDEEEDLIVNDWWESVTAARANVTLEGCAVKFLYWTHRLERLAGDTTEARVLATLHFADAWHWLHMEVYGEHQVAHHGQRAAENRKRSAPARTAKKDIQEEIVREVFEASRAQALNKNRFSTARSAASLILERVNARFKEEGLEAYTVKTLAKKLGLVVKSFKE